MKKYFKNARKSEHSEKNISHEMRLPMVPEGTKRAASFPVRCAILFSSSEEATPHLTTLQLPLRLKTVAQVSNRDETPVTRRKII